MRNHKMDLVRATAIIFVLIIHSSHEYVNNYNQEIIAGWFSTVTRPTIAMFLFVSGYFFNPNPTLPYLLKHYKRVLVPYFVFSCLAILYQQQIIGVPNYIISHWNIVLINLLMGYTWGVYWYIPTIIFVYTIAFFVLHSSQKNLIWITIVSFVINLLHGTYYAPIVDFLGVGESKVIWYYSYRFFISWPFFFFLGLTFRHYCLEEIVNNHCKKILLLWIGIFLVVNLIYFTKVGLTDMYNSVIGTIYAVSTIFLVLTIDVKSATITFVSKLSFLIYLAHYFFIAGLKTVEKMSGTVWPFWFWVFSFAISLIGPIVLYFIAKKILHDKSILIIGA